MYSSLSFSFSLPLPLCVCVCVCVSVRQKLFIMSCLYLQFSFPANKHFSVFSLQTPIINPWYDYSTVYKLIYPQSST